jgi:hypothetical protein
VFCLGWDQKVSKTFFLYFYSLKTSLFKRKPDLDSAANSYAQASSCYKIAKDLTKAIDYAQKAAEYYKQNDSFYNAAK